MSSPIEEGTVKVFRRPYRGELIRVRMRYYLEPLQVTPEHPVLAVRYNRIFTDRWRRVGIDLKNPRWIMVKELSEGDILVYPVPDFSEKVSPTYIRFSDFLDVYLKNGRLYGYTKNQFVGKCKGQIMEFLT